MQRKSEVMNNAGWDMTGKVSLITGANAGIGKRAAKRLAALGAEVIVVCRNAVSGAAAVEEIRRDTGNVKVKLLQADMSSQRSVRILADEVRTHYRRLDVLIHNAANFDLTLKKPRITDDGVETIFATNHLGPFLLTHLLLDMLKRSAPSRIITIASKGLLTFPGLTIEFDNLNGEKKFSPTHAYYHSKLAQLMFTYDLARKLKESGVTVNCIRVPSVKIDEGRHAEYVAGWLQAVYRLKRSFSIEPDTMAETYAYLAAEPALVGVTGNYYSEKNKVVSSSKKSYDETVWRKLWETSARMTGLHSGGIDHRS
jgi:NAD(P)-dependent dehydrogenase (short-subunit alcohol dehydrogenase family)